VLESNGLDLDVVLLEEVFEVFLVEPHRVVADVDLKLGPRTIRDSDSKKSTPLYSQVGGLFTRTTKSFRFRIGWRCNVWFMQLTIAPTADAAPNRFLRRQCK
jgi:hypothetical protein